MKTSLKRISSMILPVLLAVSLLAACSDEEPRVRPVNTYNPGASFVSNFNTDDPRRQIKCSIIFEVVDEAAAEELEPLNFKIRNAVLCVLGELTMDEITTDKDFEEISARIVHKVNVDLDIKYGNGGDLLNLIIGAYFTEFVIQ